ncbi:YybH family protein [Schlesneria sp. T3-172]|uniref:YybH family protein n=1 Tax=Schlesneria sphaerica TaxID=3373610 RepID=UPI0037CA4D37
MRRTYSVLLFAMVTTAFEPGLPGTQPLRAEDKKTEIPSTPNEKSTDRPASDDRASPASQSDSKSTKAVEDPLTSSDAASKSDLEVRSVGESFVKALSAAKAEEAAEFFTESAEYVDERGEVFEGRSTIRDLLAEMFADDENGSLEFSTTSVRFIGPGLAVEDGYTLFVPTEMPGDDDESGIVGRYTTVYTRIDGKWQIASLRKQPFKTSRRHRSELEQLSWLQGDWIDESDESIVLFSCEPSERGNFLLRKFVIHVEGQEIMNGTQRIGWDPLTGKLKTWIFDSEGGYAEGYWYRDDDCWKLKATGVTAEGEPASSTSIYTCVNNDTIIWQSVDHEVSGVKLPDSDPVTIVRRAPTPDMANSAAHTDSK